MPGHHSHAPIKRMARLKSFLGESIINKIVQEEALGLRDKEFWKEWNKKLELVRVKPNLPLGG